MTAPRPLLFGEVLFDRFPDGTEVLGGAPFNVAWNLHALGLAPLFVSRVGVDAPGRRVLEAMRAFGMDTSGVQVDDRHPTGAVEVRLHDGEPSYEIVTDQAYDHVDPGALPALGEPVLLCHGTLALRSRAPREVLASLLAAGPRRIVDVNLRAPWWEREAVLRAVRGAQVLKLNEHELVALGAADRPLADAARELTESLDLERIVVTRGKRGVLAVERDGRQFEAAPPALREVVDTVGAGDAFTSVLVAAECLDWSLETGLRRALELASAVVGLRGATSDRRDFYSPFCERWDLT